MRTFHFILPAILLLGAARAFGDPAVPPPAPASPPPSGSADKSAAASSPAAGFSPAAAAAPQAAATPPAASASSRSPSGKRPISISAAAAAAAAADSTPVNPRFKQVRDHIAYLFHTDVSLTPLTSPKSNPFRLAPPPRNKKAAAVGAGAGNGAEAEAGDGKLADGSDKAAADGLEAVVGLLGKKKKAVPDIGDPTEAPDGAAEADADSDGSAGKPGAHIDGTVAGPAVALKREIVSLKIEGISVLNGVTRVSIGGMLHREGDFVRPHGPGRPVWLQIIKITPTSVTFSFRDGGENGPHLTVQM